MTEGERGAEAFRRATDTVGPADLEWMMLPLDELPAELAGFEVGREAVLDNATMAAHGLPGQTVASIEEMGRITGFVREVVPIRLASAARGTLVTAGMLVHLFRDAEGVARWIDEVFTRGILANVGNLRDGGQELVHAEALSASGFHGKSAALFAVYAVPNETLGSTIVNFAVGRLLGVAFVVALGRRKRLEVARGPRTQAGAQCRERGAGLGVMQRPRRGPPGPSGRSPRCPSAGVRQPSSSSGRRQRRRR